MQQPLGAADASIIDRGIFFALALVLLEAFFPAGLTGFFLAFAAAPRIVAFRVFF
jgi:hypothetical protein